MAAPRAFLAAALVAGVVLRIAGLGWGIPSPLPPAATPQRASYHLDEGTYLRVLARGDAGGVDLHWGTLQFYLIAGALRLARWSGWLSRPWRGAFLEWDPVDFPRVFMAGRAVSALAGVLICEEGEGSDFTGPVARRTVLVQNRRDIFIKSWSRACRCQRPE